MKDLRILKESDNLSGRVKDKVFAICSNCNKQFNTTIGNLRKTGFLCKGCKISKTKQNTPADIKKIQSLRMSQGQRKVREERGLEIQEKRKQTFLERYGTENIHSASWYQQRVRQTNIDRYGEDYYKQRWQKARETMQQRYGDTCAMRIDRFRKKSRRTCLERYGCEYSFQSDNNKQKSKNTNLQKYGVDSYTKTLKRRKEISDHWKQMSDDLYKKRCQGISQGKKKHWSSVSEEYKKQFVQKLHTRYEFLGEFFDSSWELALWIYAKDHNEKIEREPVRLDYVFENTVHHYYPDFRYRGQIIELKNDYLLEKMNIPDTIDNGKLKCLQEHNILIWNLQEIQFALDYVNQTYTSDFLDLFKLRQPFPYIDHIRNVNNDYDIIRYFHKSIYEASKTGYLSPFEAWQNKDLVLRSALNRLQYVGNCKPETVIRGFSVARIAPKVSVFKSSLVETLVKKYLRTSETIFDPFSGFSGRMLGAVRCNKRYIGQDLNEKHVRESNEIINFKQLQNCMIIQQDILKDSKKTFQNTSLFTCPPYADKEFWTKDRSEVTKTCDEWITLCLEKYKCDRYLFVVDQTNIYKDKIVEYLGNQNGLFKRSPEIVILITS